MAGQGGVVEGDLGVEADQALDGRAVGVVLADHGERVDLHEVGVDRDHRPQQALGDRGARLPVRPEPDLERQLARRVVRQAEQGIGVLVDDRLGVVDRDLLDLDAALGGPDEHQATGGSIEHDREVVLLDDLRGRADEHAPDREALDLEREDLRRDVLGLVRVTGEPDAAGLAAATDEDLRLDHHLAGRVRRVAEEPDGGRTGLGGRPRHLPRGDRAVPGRGAATSRRLRGSSRGERTSGRMGPGRASIIARAGRRRLRTAPRRQDGTERAGRDSPYS